MWKGESRDLTHRKSKLLLQRLIRLYKHLPLTKYGQGILYTLHSVPNMIEFA